MRIVCRNFTMAFVPLLFVVLVGAAEEVPELVTDRPDQTESAVAVPPGFTQLELGWTHTEENEDGEDFEADTFPETLIRYGLVEDLELRLGFSGYAWEELDDGTGTEQDFEGWQDTEVGFKYRLWDEDSSRCLPEAALLAHLSLPTGADGHTSERFDPNFRFSFAHTLTDRLDFGYNLGMVWETGEDDRGERDTTAAFQYTAALGMGITERLGAFVELFGDIPTNGPGGPRNSFDGGFTYLVSDNFQFDIEAGTGLSEDADDWFFGVGVAYRFPK